MSAAVFASQPSVGLTAPLPRYRNPAAAAEGFVGQVSPVLSPQPLPISTSTPSPVCLILNLLPLFNVCDNLQ